MTSGSSDGSESGVDPGISSSNLASSARSTSGSFYGSSGWSAKSLRSYSTSRDTGLVDFGSEVNMLAKILTFLSRKAKSWYSGQG